MKPAFPEIERIRYEGPELQEPARLPPLQRRRKGRRQDDARPPAVQRRLLAHVPRHGLPIRSAPARAVRPWEDGTDSVENAQNRARVAFEFMEKLGDAVLLLPRPRRRPRRRRRSPRSNKQPRRRRQGAQGRAAAHRHQAALGHRQPVQQSAATCTAPPRAATPTSSPTPPPR